MILGKPVSLFVLTPPKTEETAGGASAQPGTEVNKPVVTPLESILPNGSIAGISPLMARYGVKQFSNIDWSKVLAGETATTPEGAKWQPLLRIPQTPVAATPATTTALDAQISGNSVPLSAAPSTAAVTAPGSGEDQSLKGRGKAAWGIFSGTVTVLHVTQGMSQAQVVHYAAAAGIPQQQATTIADGALKLLHSQGGHAVSIGVVAGGAAGALATLLGYKKHAAVIGIVVALVVIGLMASLGKEQNPFIGKWNMNAIETNYESGIPPRQVVEEITGDKNGVKITSTAIEEGGKRDHSTRQIQPDGRLHPAGQDGSIVATMKDGTLHLEYSQNGQITETETRTLSSDQKKMTVTTSGRGANGAPYKNVTVYDRE